MLHCADFLETVGQLKSHLAEVMIQECGHAVPIKTMTGSTPAKKRNAVVESFNCVKGPAIFILTIKACALGINLTSATRAIMGNPMWNPMVRVSFSIDPSRRLACGLY
jgi:SNF2 family DNA or RNA helicase